ncbi:MAG: DUF302 domain-containing protein [Candidatus Eremiobacteraeota bacterium]|nr:DUF302 domain-containing protein [Candidatus Eremiobacteraeota bacterium]
MNKRQVSQLSIRLDEPYEDFRQRFLAAVPPFDAARLNEFVERRAAWSEVVAAADATAPHGFFIYWSLDVDPSMALNGNTTRCCEYLMGNHTIAERMFRINATAMLYVPLRIVVFQEQGGLTTFVIEKPSDILGSLLSPQIDAVGIELDRKLAELFRHIALPVPKELATS